ncbi:hypothetical protein DFH06DRAFT_1171130 [Mycena polygramma]|nr:hypothetical protein DFH06DRAFT_1171130 [Mycena polygramma]
MWYGPLLFLNGTALEYMYLPTSRVNSVIVTLTRMVYISSISSASINDPLHLCLATVTFYDRGTINTGSNPHLDRQTRHAMVIQDLSISHDGVPTFPRSKGLAIVLVAEVLEKFAHGVRWAPSRAFTEATESLGGAGMRDGPGGLSSAVLGDASFKRGDSLFSSRAGSSPACTTIDNSGMGGRRHGDGKSNEHREGKFHGEG